LDHTEIITRIIELRKKLRLTQKEFAPIINVQSNTLSRWETKRNVPLPMAIKRMEEILRLMPKRQEEKSSFGRLDAMLKFMQKRRGEENIGIEGKNK